MKSRTPWTTDEVTLLEDLAKRNTSLQVIALKLGRSAAAVESKAAQLKIEIRRIKRRYTRNYPTAAGELHGQNSTRDRSDDESARED